MRQIFNRKQTCVEARKTSKNNIYNRMAPLSIPASRSRSGANAEPLVGRKVMKPTPSKASKKTKRIVKKPKVEKVPDDIPELTEGETKRQMAVVKKAASDLQNALKFVNVDNEDSGSEEISQTDFNNFAGKALQMSEILTTVFGLKNNKVSNQKRFKKYQTVLESFLTDLITLSGSMTEPTAVEAIIDLGLIPLVPLYVSMENIGKLLVKQLTVFWATSHKKLRLAAFVCLYRTMMSSTEKLFEYGAKGLYSVYLSSIRLTTTDTMPLINFMRTSLQEIYLLNEPVAYKHGFNNIRLLAVHIRSALVTETEEDKHMVFNWQYIHSLRMWAELVSKSHPSPTLQPLVYPIVQICTGVLSLKNNMFSYPTYFHIFKTLTHLSRATGKFVPVLSNMLDMLKPKFLNTKPKQIPFNKFDWDSQLKMTSTDILTPGFSDDFLAVWISNVMDYLSVHSASIAFPELVFPAVSQMKQFLSKVTNAKKVTILKRFLSKVQENVAFIEKRRSAVTFKLTDTESIRSWEIETQQAGTPLNVTFEKLKSKIPTKVDAGVENVAFSLAAIIKEKTLEEQQEDSDSDNEEQFEDDIDMDSDSGVDSNTAEEQSLDGDIDEGWVTEDEEDNDEEQDELADVEDNEEEDSEDEQMDVESDEEQTPLTNGKRKGEPAAARKNKKQRLP